MEKNAYISRSSAAALALVSLLLPILGSLPFALDALADNGQAFFHGHAPDHAIHYFAWVNLKGFVYSAIIGAALYLLVVRRVIVRRRQDGEIAAAVLWPAALDLEELFYRPVFKHGVAFAALLMRAAAAAPDKFLSLFFRRSQPIGNESGASDRFSIGLILAGAGVCVTLIYVLLQAL